MKRMRKSLCIMLAFILVLASALTGCSKDKDSASNAKEDNEKVQETASDTSEADVTQAIATPTVAAEPTASTPTGEKKKVYLVITNKDDYVMSMRNNFVKELELKGFKEGENLEITETNLEGDFNKCVQVIEDIKTLNPDLVFAECSNGNIIKNLVTPLAETDIPLVMGIFAEQGAALHDNITGVKTFPSYLQEEAFKLLNKIAPINGKKAVFITNPGVFNKEDTEAALNKNGIELKEYLETAIVEDFQDFVTRNEKDDEVGWVLYGLTPWTQKKDGTFIQRSDFISWEIANSKKPNISYWESAVRNFMLAGTAVDLDASSIQAADIGVRILNGEKPIDIPPEEPTKIMIVLNQQRAKEKGIVFPTDILDAAKVYTDYKGTYIK